MTESAEIALNRERQRELYGAPLGDRVRRLTTALKISQAHLARTIGISPAMLSQLVSGRRVKIGDPAVLSRFLMLDERSRSGRVLSDPKAVEALLAEVARSRWHWTTPHVPARRGHRRSAISAVDALRSIAEPARLAAAAAALGPTFPELADALRQAAGRGQER
jgi:transcriptional regulator with XRE-family HTH domain